jgi:DNA-binding MurR/RpiR family transcriptional regulator
MVLEDWVRERADTTTIGPKARQVVDLLVRNPKFCAYASASQLGDRVGTDASTVVRTAKAMGFAGWPELQAELRSRYLSSLDATALLDLHQNSDNADPIVRALRNDLDALNETARTLDVAACRAIATAIAAARRTLAVGSGSFAGPLTQLVHVASRLGLAVDLADHGGRNLITSLGLLRPGDALVVLHPWRLTTDVLAAATVARDQGSTVCVISDSRSTPLTRLADHQVVVPAEGVSHFPTLTPTAAVIHAVLAELTEQAGETGKAAIQRHDRVFAQVEKLRRGNQS